MKVFDAIHVNTFERELTQEDGIYRFLAPEFRAHLDRYNSVLDQWDKRQKVDFKCEVDLLPFAANSRFWRERQKDIQVLERATSLNNLRILEIGGMMGWLSNYLAQKNDVLSIDYLTSPEYGLKARNKYANPNWLSVNMDFEDLSFVKGKFDLIVFNRNLAYVPNYLDVISQSIEMLTEEGKIFASGLNIYKVRPEFNSLYQSSAAHFKKHGLNIDLKAGTTRFLDIHDQAKLEDLGFEFFDYDKSFLSKLKTKLIKPKSISKYAFFRKGA